MVNGNYVLYGDRPSSASEIVDDHVQTLTTDRRSKRKVNRYTTENGHKLQQLDNETDSVKYEKKINEPRLLRYVPTTDVEEHFVNENFETYDLKPAEERPRRYAFIKKPRNPSDGSVNYAYSRSSSSSPSMNLPTISEHSEQYGTYRVRNPHHETPKMVDVQTGYESKLDKYFTKPRDLKFPPKVSYNGSHPDSLYRVPNDSDADASKLSRMFRTLRWPVALIVICVALAVFVYFLMPDHMNTELELVNSTFWNTNPNVPPKEKLQDTSDRSVGLQTTSTNVLSTTQPTKKPVPQCHSPRQAMCRGVLPYDLAGPAPTLDGKPIAKMLPQMEYLLATNCSIRARQFLCSLLEPECNPPPFPPKMPCFSLCKAVMDYCDEFIPRELVNAFKCNQYPSINCISARSPCGRRELQCRDGTCVPRDWMCDGNRDCSTGDDEEPCITCEKGQYKCPTSGACVKKEWICDGYNDCPDGDDEDSILCKQTNSQRNPTAAASEEHEGEEAVGSAPAPSVRRPNHLPTARTRSQFRGDDSKELLITSDSNNGFRRNFTRRPSPSRLTPYRPKHREPPIRDDNNESEEQVAKSHKKRPDAKLDDKIYSDDNINIEDLGLFEEFTKDNKEQRKQYREREKASLMGGAPYPSGYSDPAPKKTHSTQKPKAQTEIIDDDGIPPPKTTKLDKSNKYERIIDGAALLRKAAEEAKRAAEISTEPFRMAYDDFPAISTSGGRSHSSPCPSGELRCVDGRCINLAQLCDGTIDCSDHADEDNCYT
ncbi:uncharacterized protein LOC113230561 isoform X5 [Hyposmocoma kahamanoa]|uniref:uncharacterized protein LOC113230561 isoform X5 n=1 Tax=Hyposmocoma kahamanoa TaxID=1477025 RepID=UPI000E6D8147|nr:uncharacterized protein LOC113230561 isoform X5 [Hyposmocoma kahamanoa]